MASVNEYIGREVKKRFGKLGIFKGKVMSFDEETGYYRILYSDGDSEDVELSELLPILIDPSKVSSGTKQGKTPSKPKTCKTATTSRSRSSLNEKKSDDLAKTNSSTRKSARVSSEPPLFPVNSNTLAPRKDLNESLPEDLPNSPSNADQKRKSDVFMDPPFSEISTLKSNENDLNPLAPPRRSERSRRTASNQTETIPSDSFEKCEDEYIPKEYDSDENKSNDESYDTVSDSSSYSPKATQNRQRKQNKNYFQRIKTTSKEMERLATLYMPLPPSSSNLPMEKNLLFELVSIYLFLLSFSNVLFLSPFTLSMFSSAICSDRRTHLMDSIHHSLLRKLKELINNTNDAMASPGIEFIRRMDWDLMTTRTWSTFLAPYLLARNFSSIHGKKHHHILFSNREYHAFPLHVKIVILSFLCNELLQTTCIKDELDRRSKFIEEKGGEEEEVEEESLKNVDVKSSNSEKNVKGKLEELKFHDKEKYKDEGNIRGCKVEFGKEYGKQKGVVLVENIKKCEGGENEVVLVEGEQKNQNETQELIENVSRDKNGENEGPNSTLDQIVTGPNIYDECCLCHIKGYVISCHQCKSFFHPFCINANKYSPSTLLQWRCCDCQLSSTCILSAGRRMKQLRLEKIGMDAFHHHYNYACDYLFVYA